MAEDRVAAVAEAAVGASAEIAAGAIQVLEVEDVSPRLCNSNKQQCSNKQRVSLPAVPTTAEAQPFASKSEKAAASAAQCTQEGRMARCAQIVEAKDMRCVGQHV
jgi:hypothetical protein